MRACAGRSSVTGASSGIGEACALRLARGGFDVFAGVRKDEDAERADALHERVRPLRLDGAMLLGAVAREPDRRGLLLIPLVIGASALMFFLVDLFFPY